MASRSDSSILAGGGGDDKTAGQVPVKSESAHAATNLPKAETQASGNVAIVPPPGNPFDHFAAQGGAASESAWRPVVDPATNMTYYHNTETNQTAWTLPTASGAPE